MKTFTAILAAWMLPYVVYSFEEPDYAWVNEMLYEFPGVGNDLTKVTWAHAVNSQAELKKALKGDAMFLEADVSIGRHVEDPEQLLPIMAHPPNTTSDLTLQQFLDEVLKTEKHIKLDFKSRMAFSASESIIEDAQMKNNYGQRIWLNADIIPGPIKCDKPVVDANYFLSTCVTKFPDTVISAGWSTCYSQTLTEGGYTSEQIEEMTDALNTNMVMGAVSFPVRAGLAAQSIKQLVNLMKTARRGTTLTIWSSPGDPVNILKLLKLINTVGRDKIFLDVPEELMTKMAIVTAYQQKNIPMSAASLTVSLTLVAILTLINIF